MNFIFKAVPILLIAYACYCGLMFLVQRHMMFPRYLMGPAPPVSDNIAGLEKIWLQTNSGNVEAWFLQPARDENAKPAPAIIFAHGNAELIDGCLQEFMPFTRWGIGVLLVEYPGYGRSQGRPSQKSITDALLKAYDVLMQRADVDASRIILYGRSLGGGAICRLAARRPSMAMILQSSFTSARAFASRYLVPGALVRDPFDNLAVVGAYRQPILIIHGRHDEVIAYRHGAALHQAALNSKMITYACGHNDCPPDPKIYWQDIQAFLAGVGIESSNPKQR